MKILFYISEQDVRLHEFIKCLQQTDHVVGVMGQEINQQQIEQFGPDIIIHNLQGVTSFPISSKAVSININESEGENCFSFENKKSENFLDSFVTNRNNTFDKDMLNKFQSDILYMGNIADFGHTFRTFIKNNNDIILKFFTPQLNNLVGYCGILDINHYGKYYKHAKASIVFAEDAARIKDIIVSDGNPVMFDIEKKEKFITDLTEAVKNNKRFSIDGMTKESIINNDTSYDRVAKIFKTVGLNKIVSDIMKQKRKDWGSV